MKKVLLIFLFFLTINIQHIAQSESDWILRLFNFSSDVTSISDDAVSLAVDAAWKASELTGYETITGTLTQNSTDSWSYTASPSDKLVALFYDGSRIEFKYTSIAGYVDGDAEDFKESHAMDFTTYIENYINIRIISNTGPADGKIQWQRTITGNIISKGDNQSVNIQHNGDRQSEIGSGFAFQYVNETVQGTSSSGLASYSVNDQFHITIAHDSNAGIFNKDTQFWKNSSVTTGGTTYTYQGMNVFYVGGTTLYANAENGIYNEVINDYQWSSEGTLLKNNQLHGNILFSEAPANSTYGPYLIAKLNSGGEITLHYLLNSAPTNVKDKSTDIITEYHMLQNYPNPFNPSTRIKYSIPSVETHGHASVQLKIYDFLGREVATLVNKQQKPGNYEVEFNPVSSSQYLASGVYFYKIQIGNYSQVKKMILQK